jgi:hypothetical protein
VKALNFYSSVYHGILVVRDKRCTIRLGDKRAKYDEGDLVWVTHGNRFRPRQKVFTAVVDRVTLKKVSELTPEDLSGENPDMKSPADAAAFLKSIYGREIGPDDQVTVVYFSEVIE